MHPEVVTLPARNYYTFKFRNKTTGEFIMDAFGADYASWNVVGGKYYILSAIGYPLLPGWDMLYVDYAEL